MLRIWAQACLRYTICSHFDIPKVVRVLGKVENTERFLQLALFQGVPTAIGESAGSQMGAGNVPTYYDLLTSFVHTFSTSQGFVCTSNNIRQRSTKTCWKCRCYHGERGCYPGQNGGSLFVYLRFQKKSLLLVLTARARGSRTWIVVHW